jgi:osmotically-inducible protein OsmY
MGVDRRLIMPKTDSQLQRDVLRELVWDGRVEATEVGVALDRGVVTLTGTVSSWAKRVAAQDAAQRVAGVLDVANNIDVRLDRLRTDTEVADAVRRSLEWDALVPHERIQSTVSNGWVTLQGNVDTFAECEDAERAVQNLIGLRGVTNKITVCSAKPVNDLKLMPVEGASDADDEITQAVRTALKTDPFVNADQISVSTLGRVVTLTGVVPKNAEREMAELDAWNVAGVDEVRNTLLVCSKDRRVGGHGPDLGMETVAHLRSD